MVLLTAFSIIVSSGQFVGDPIHCWTPAEFPMARVAYTKSLCWVSNTYYVPMSDEIPTDLDFRERSQITYYQWVPIILLFMALLFKFPNIMWRLIHSYSGINMDKICSLSTESQMTSPEDRAKKISHVTKYIHRWIDSQRDYHDNFLVKVRRKFSNIVCFCYGKRDGTFLTGLYLFVKMLYCVNVIAQFFMLNSFMSMDYNNFGLEILIGLIHGNEWKESPRFPRVTFCDMEIRQLNNVQRWTIQCVLPINLFNEKIFIFLWFWLLLVAILTFINYFKWIFNCMFKENKTKFVKKYLKMNRVLQSSYDQRVARKFIDSYLRQDGVFVLRIISKNSSDMVLTDIIVSLWKIFKESYIACKKDVHDSGDKKAEFPLLNGSTPKEKYV